MLSRKYYIAIAAALRESADMEDITQALCRLFRADNPRFDSGRFMDAIKPRSK